MSLIVKGKTNELKYCKHCGKDIIVARIEPPDNIEEITGVIFQSMDENYDYIFLGYLCNNCAWLGQSKGLMSLGSFDALASSKYFDKGN